jgi:hypothetical protein
MQPLPRPEIILTLKASQKGNQPIIEEGGPCESLADELLISIDCLHNELVHALPPIGINEALKRLYIICINVNGLLKMAHLLEMVMQEGHLGSLIITP